MRRGGKTNTLNFALCMSPFSMIVGKNKKKQAACTCTCTCTYYMYADECKK